MSDKRIKEIEFQRKTLNAMSIAVHQMVSNKCAPLYMKEAYNLITEVGGKDIAIAYLLGQNADTDVIMSIQSL